MQGTSGFSGLTYEQIRTIASNLDAKASAMQTLLDDVSATIKTLGEGSNVWSGTSATESVAKFNKLVEQFPNFYDAVKACSKKLNDTVALYESVDQSVISGY